MKPELKQILLTTSAHALKLTQISPKFNELFIDDHNPFAEMTNYQGFQILDTISSNKKNSHI